MREEWRDCFGGVYSVSNLGRVRRNVRRASGRPGRIMRSIVNRGYHYVVLSDRSHRCRASVHSLVAAAFIGVRPFGHDINHKNAIKSDNRAANLEYVTHAENGAHAARLGLCSGGSARGEQQGSAKLTESDELASERVTWRHVA